MNTEAVFGSTFFEFTQENNFRSCFFYLDMKITDTRRLFFEVVEFVIVRCEKSLGGVVC